MTEHHRRLADIRVSRRKFLKGAAAAPAVIHELFTSDTADARQVRPTLPQPQPNPCVSNPNLCNSVDEDNEEWSDTKVATYVGAVAGMGAAAYGLTKTSMAGNDLVELGKVVGSIAVGAGVGSLAGYAVAESLKKD